MQQIVQHIIILHHPALCPVKHIITSLHITSHRVTQHRLLDAILFTQANWRKKKSYVAATNLEKLKEDQEIFSRSKGVSTSLHPAIRALLSADKLDIIV